MDSTVTSYSYDGYNNRIEKVENGVHTSYLYDNRNRLTKETVTDNGQTAVTSYQYDPNGNLYSRQTLTFAEDNTQEPKVSAVLMGYTAETDDMLLEYNNFNQLTATTGDEMVSYDYYANGMRKSKTVDGVTTTHIWDGQNMAGEITEDNFTGYLRGARLIARQMGDNTQYYHFNGHGDTSSITDGNGTALRNYTYDAFGNVEHLHDLDTNPFRYCGEYYDAETGFIYLRNRYYDPSMGRFISEDPVRDGLNWYVYCRNNPIKYIDPTGYWATSDSKYSSTVQAMLLQLTVAWHMAPTGEQKTDISNRANEIRETVSSGFGAFLDKGKSITGAAADEFSWFLGGDVSGAERDYWLSEAQKYQSDIKIDDETGLRSMMFIAGIISPSPDDAWRMISKKASKEMLETVGEKGAKKFIKSISKYAGAQGTNGIKKLQGSGIKGFMYEVKVKGVGGAYRLLGNKTESGEILWELFEKTH